MPMHNSRSRHGSNSSSKKKRNRCTWHWVPPVASESQIGGRLEDVWVAYALVCIYLGSFSMMKSLVALFPSIIRHLGTKKASIAACVCVCVRTQHKMK